MRQLTFHDVPTGPLPLFLGEPREKVVDVAHLVCDHAAGVAYFRPADPFQTFALPAHSAQRFSMWEVDPMLPRWQVVDLYAEARPLIQQVHAGTTVRTTPAGWIRSQTQDALTAFNVIDEMMCEAPVEICTWARTTPLVPFWLSRQPSANEYPHTGMTNSPVHTLEVIWQAEETRVNRLRLTDEPVKLREGLKVVQQKVLETYRHSTSAALRKPGSLDRVLKMQIHRDIKPSNEAVLMNRAANSGFKL